MKEILKDVRDKTAELLLPHQGGHPITYNHYFTETLQRVRRERMRPRGSDEVTAILRQFFGPISIDSRTYLDGSYKFEDLVRSLTESADNSEPDMKRFAAGEALDCLDAYYKVALKRFIDDVAVEAVEAKLVSALDNILSPLSIYQMSDEQVARIAWESEETRTERERLSRQLEVLRNGLDTCRRFVGFRVSGGSIFVPAKQGNNFDSFGHSFDGLEEPSDAHSRQETVSVRSASPTPETAYVPSPLPVAEPEEYSPQLDEGTEYIVDSITSVATKSKKKNRGKFLVAKPEL
ncbi:hypothetical protein VTK56DRAFT_907 [Thermocarpiscus australiensis]